MKKTRPIEAKYKRWFNSLDKPIVLLFNVLIDGKLPLIVNDDSNQKMVLKEDLVASGISLDNVDFLVRNEILVSNGNDEQFVLSDKFYELLFEYGIKLRLDRMSEKTYRFDNRINFCFRMCYENQKSINFVWHWVLINVEDKKYGEAYDIICKVEPGQFEELGSEACKKISCYKNLFLYLLAFAANYGDKQLIDVSSFCLRDMFYIPKGKSGNKYLKQMIKEILEFKFKMAVGTLHDNKNHGDKFYNHNEEYKVQFELLFVLLNKVIERNSSNSSLIGMYVDKKQFQYIVKLLDTEVKQRPLSDKEKCILLICKEIIGLQEGKMTPIVVVSNKSDTGLKGIHKIYELISGRQYKEALQECSRIKDKVKGPNLLYELLDYLNKLIDGREGPLSKFDIVGLVDELEYTKGDSDVVFAYSVCCNALETGVSIDEYGGLTVECRQLTKLVYARICYYRAKECYDFAYDCYYLGDVSYKADYDKAVRCFYEYMVCGDKIVDEISNGTIPLNGVVLNFLDDVKAYKSRIGVSSEVKKLAKK